MDRNGRFLRTWGKVRVKGRVGTREGTDESSIRSSTDFSFASLFSFVSSMRGLLDRSRSSAVGSENKQALCDLRKCESHGRFISQSSILS